MCPGTTPCATNMIRGCPPLPDTAPPPPAQWLCGILSTYCRHIYTFPPLSLLTNEVGARCYLSLVIIRGHPFSCGRLGVGAQAVCLLFSSVEVQRKQVSTDSWPEQNLVSQPAVAQTVVCLS